MGYRVIYHDEKSKMRRSKAPFLTTLFFALFMGWVFRYWDQGREVVAEFLLSDADRMLEAMAERIDSGTGLMEAAQAFFSDLGVGSIEGPY